MRFLYKPCQEQAVSADICFPALSICLVDTSIIDTSIVDNPIAGED